MFTVDVKQQHNNCKRPSGFVSEVCLLADPADLGLIPPVGRNPLNCTWVPLHRASQCPDMTEILLQRM